MKYLRIPSLLLAVAIVVAVLWFYFWIVGSPRVFLGQQSDYYNLLVDGFQKGQLAMDVTPDPWMGVDGSKVTHYLLDASFHQGKYYLYFGATPALLLIWPWTAITGHDLPEEVAVLLLTTLAYLLSLGWLGTLQRRFAPATGFWFWPLAALMLGIAAGYPVVLRRPIFYEIAILAGVTCNMAGLWCLTLALLRRAQAVRWLALASLCAGLAAGSRPTLTPGAVLAVGAAAFAVGWLEVRDGTGLTRRRVLRLGLAAVLPAGLCGAMLAWYNWARFGSPWDFGILHQVGSNAGGFSFTFGNLWTNLGLYYFTAPSFSWFFPFFGVGANPPGVFREQVHGQLFVVPVLLLAGAAGLWAMRRKPVGPRVAGAVAVVAALWGGVTLVVDCMAPPHSNRYQLDFHPILIVGLLLGLAVARAQGCWRWPVRAAVVWCGVVVFFNLCTNFSVHGFFRAASPQAFARIARVADRLAWPLHRLSGPRLGGLEVVVKFPEGRPGTIEPLIVTGGGHDMDALVVKYGGPGQGKLAFIHLDHGEVESEILDLQPGKARWLKIHLGSLYPPAWHPWYESLPSDMARAANRVSVKMDGVEVLSRDVVCYQASANQVRLGERGGFLIGEPAFAGEIERVRGLKADTAWLQGVKERTGPWRLRVLLPRDRFGSTEPLLLAGEIRRTEFLSVTYVRDGVIRLSFLHEGWSVPLTSPDIAWDYMEPLEVLVDLGPGRLRDPESGERADGVTVEVAGQTAISHDFETYPFRPAQAYVGCTPWSMSGSRPMFGGQVLPEPAEGPEPVAVRWAKQMLLDGGPVEMLVTFPGRTANQPIFTTGAPGIGDGLFVEYLSDTEIRFGFDHWGSQAVYSEPVKLEPGKMHRLTVSLGARVSARGTVPGRLLVKLNGDTVFEQPVDLFPADQDRLFFGANPIGLSTSRPEFGGTLVLPARARAMQSAPPVTSP